MIKLQSKTNVGAPDSEYTYGQILDQTETQDGTPGNAEVYQDIHQFFEGLVREAEVTPNDLPDNDYNGYQLMEAFLKLTLKKKVIEIGPWNMDSTSAVSKAHGIADFTQIRTVSAVIFVDGGVGAEILLNEGDGYFTIFATQITLTRVAAGRFDGPVFSDTSINRGYITIEYDPNA